MTLKSQASSPDLLTLVISVLKPVRDNDERTSSNTSFEAPRSSKLATNISPLIPE